MNADSIGETGSRIEGGRLPPLAALRCFEAAARLESFSRAADALNLTHGAVSRAVRLLEDDLGVALFERRSRRVFLTDDGRRLAKAVREGLGLIAASADGLRDRGRAGPVTLSCEPTLLMRWLIPRLPAFHRAHPGIDVHLVAAGGPVALGGAINLAIRRSDFPLAPGTRADDLFEERMGPICRADMIDRFFDRSAKVPTLRADARLLHSQSRPNAWATWCADAGTAPPAGPSQAFEHFYLSLQAAMAGLGVAMGSWHMARDDIASGVLAAPFGFTADGSRYLLLSPEATSPQIARSRDALVSWMARIN
ncbi:LysR substrate-binding domain-containing protein [Aureimonas phyllosphaerae]|uniref:DNA-binding transcriptional LysR family regulator n=1 Tax=Aureimonas phyllosphaerae TaxID=1166078 RepID=A0A7W6BSL1_9HYPH|nr:LysR substrate-binding domain-containing protein [Aureimonas phyllosphaerae]MBB3937266.1 DNA-binding transcriptional LysR family regulator [Aureimonas phyllosphaerae]MBB3961273.1 DNA-binding transcriptional LysR family regulator [Aureimonas phyllosphaerae]SFF58032.1 transcriptional regulator, LysR family [Aureimonas phyllosphaerae]